MPWDEVCEVEELREGNDVASRQSLCAVAWAELCPNGVALRPRRFRVPCPVVRPAPCSKAPSENSLQNSVFPCPPPPPNFEKKLANFFKKNFGDFKWVCKDPLESPNAKKHPYTPSFTV